MRVKKYTIAAMVGVMLLAVTAPAFAANLGGTLNFGYNYDLNTMTPTAPTAMWGVNVAGNVGENVACAIGFESNNILHVEQGLWPTEAWIQAKETPIGSVKLGAFDMSFSELNNTYWTAVPNFPLNVQVDNGLAGVNISTGVQFDNGGSVYAVGAAANMKPLDELDVTLGVLAENPSAWSPRFGYNATYTGVEDLTLGVKGNLQVAEVVGSAAYQIMPEVKLNGMYGVNVPISDSLEDDLSIAKAGVDAAFKNGLHGGASYAVENRSITGHHTVMSLNGGYDFELTKGLTVGIDASHVVDNASPTSGFGVTAGVSF